MSVRPSRCFLPVTGHIADANAVLRHPAENAAWIWHPAKAATETAVLRFRLRFELKEDASPVLHVTADQRFQLRCDGHDVTFGPDRCDLEHWTVQSVLLPLAAGPHELEAIAWFISDPPAATRCDAAPGLLVPFPPMAQITWRGGFLLHAENAAGAVLSTGAAPWLVEDLTDAVTMTRPQLPNYHDIGPSFSFNLERWHASSAVAAGTIHPPLVPNHWGLRRSGWCLAPANLPEQRREPWTGGRIRAFRPSHDDAPIAYGDTVAREIAAWQALLDQGKPVIVPPHSQYTLLWDFESYLCGYPVTRTHHGKDADVEWSWAEALYEASNVQDIGERTPKGHRDQVEGKVFVGVTDQWRIAPEIPTDPPSLWWRSGRYVRLRITTTDAPLTVTHLGLVTTGYPLDVTGAWSSSDAAWDGLMPLFHDSFRVSAHEHWTDTPYYEQMCYVGDNALHGLSNYAWYDDARLSRRSLELFEWSRRASASGLVAERYPSNWRQESATYCLIWPQMLRDYAWWRDEPAFLKSMLPGLRGVLAEIEALAHDDGLLHHVPGWPFVDWVQHPGWTGVGCGPGVREGDSSVVNLHWVLALIAAGQIEDAHGDGLLARRHQSHAHRLMQRILARFWDDSQQLLLDTLISDFTSEHAQMYALLTGLLDEKQTRGCIHALRKNDRLARASISSAFHVLDALYRHGEEEEFHRRLEFWRALPTYGFTVTPEAGEPSRSDSHAWGAHPAWHTLASIAGVRPAAPGFARAVIAPLPGSLQDFSAKVVHPRGAIEVAFRRGSGNAAFDVRLPDGITAQLRFAGKSFDLPPGPSRVVV